MRVALLPLSWSLAHRAALRQAKLTELEPAVKSIRERYARDPRMQMQKVMELHRQHGLAMADSKSLLGAFLQMPVIYGLYKALSRGAHTGAFLWIRNLGRPDAILGILAALSTAVAMAVAPQMSEHTRLILILLPAVLCFFAALHFSSGVVLYWVASNLCGAAQTLALRKMTRRPGIN